MGLIIGIVLFIYILITHAPASASLRQGRENYEAMRRRDAEDNRKEAEATDRYYNPATGYINRNFYSDGSVYCDVSTGKYYDKGEYYCRADGVKADAYKAGANVPRPPIK